MNLPRICNALATTFFFVAACSPPAPTPQSGSEQTLNLVREWVQGNFNNATQAEADAAADLSQELMHRPMHRLFVPIEAANIEAILFTNNSQWMALKTRP